MYAENSAINIEKKKDQISINFQLFCFQMRVIVMIFEMSTHSGVHLSAELIIHRPFLA